MGRGDVSFPTEPLADVDEVNFTFVETGTERSRHGSSEADVLDTLERVEFALEEGTPTVIIEALARGLPVVSTTHSAIPEVVQDGKTGFLVPERDVDGLADRLRHLIENRSDWADMGRRGRESVTATYDINK